MPETTGENSNDGEVEAVEIHKEWNQTKDDMDEKQFVDGDDSEENWAVTFQKCNGEWSYTVSRPGVSPTADSAKSVDGIELFLNALHHAEAVVASEQEKA